MPLLCPANTFVSLKPQVSSDSAWSPQHSGLCHLQLVFYSKSEKGSSVINIQAYLCSHACLHYSVSNRCNVMCGYCGERKRMRSPLLTFISVAVIQWAAVWIIQQRKMSSLLPLCFFLFFLCCAFFPIFPPDLFSFMSEVSQNFK